MKLAIGSYLRTYLVMTNMFREIAIDISSFDQYVQENNFCNRLLFLGYGIGM